jgi:hypothetical protein
MPKGWDSLTNIALPRLLSSRHDHNDNSSSPDLLILTSFTGILLKGLHLIYESSPRAGHGW